MKKYILIFSIAVSFPFQFIFGQWEQMQDFGGSPRSFSNGFTIGDKVYIAGGFDSSSPYDDFWEYDINLDTWTQKDNLPMGFRSGAVTFSIGGKGYLCTGNNGFQYLNDLWEYDPVANNWTQKVNFPGEPRDEAVVFVIGTKAYVGTGQQFIIGDNNSFTSVYSDFYEYDSEEDTWSQKASMPGDGRAYAVGVSAAGKGYVGLGGNNDQTASFTDFYEYDPLTDEWTEKVVIQEWEELMRVYFLVEMTYTFWVELTSQHLQ